MKDYRKEPAFREITKKQAEELKTIGTKIATSSYAGFISQKATKGDSCRGCCFYGSSVGGCPYYVENGRKKFPCLIHGLIYKRCFIHVVPKYKSDDCETCFDCRFYDSSDFGKSFGAVGVCRNPKSGRKKTRQNSEACGYYEFGI